MNRFTFSKNVNSKMNKISLNIHVKYLSSIEDEGNAFETSQKIKKKIIFSRRHNHSFILLK